LLCATVLPSLAFGQTYYKCRTASGGVTYSDKACSQGAQQEQVVSEDDRPQRYEQGYAPAYAAPQRSSKARLLDAKVADALSHR